MTRPGLRRSRAAIVVGVWAVLAVLAVPLRAAAQAPAAGPALPVLRWGGDPEGGLPFVGADPADPDRVTGFDVEIAALVARGLGRTPQFVSVQFQSIDASVRRGDFDIGWCGLEDTPGRRASLALTVPYYEFAEVLAVRAADAAHLRALADLRGRRVATLGGTMAYEILLEAERTRGLTAVSYDDDVHPYEDLLNGRVDAVLLDHVLADKAMRRHRGLVRQPGAVAIGHYVGVLAPGNAALRDRVDVILREAMRDGTLERIFRRWNAWNDDQATLYARVLAAPSAAPPAPAPLPYGGPPAALATTSDPASPPSQFGAVVRYLPAILRAALVTIVLSCAAMALAVVLGIGLASGRVYGGRLLRGACTAYVELTRGTPVLLQLFVLYYGLAEVVRLPAFVAALLGLGLNYAAYESEIYRAALEAVSAGQLDAARILGLSERQVFTLVRGPQALRLALAPMTNDFVALLKDSSLVSVLTVVELTKQTAIFAANIGSWVVPGVLCAALYLAMSLPLSRLARRLEARWKAPTA